MLIEREGNENDRSVAQVANGNFFCYLLYNGNDSFCFGVMHMQGMFLLLLVMYRKELVHFRRR